MRVIFLLNFFLISGINTIFGQSISFKKDSTFIYQQLAKADYYINKNGGYDSAYSNSLSAYNLSHNLKYERGEAQALIQLAKIVFKNAELRQSDNYNSLALPIVSRLKDSLLLAELYKNIGINQSYKGNQKDAINNFEKALTLKYERDQSTKTASVYNAIGNAYMEMGELDKQMDWQTKALSLYEKKDDQKGIAQVLDNIAGLYLELGQNVNAILYAKRAADTRESLDNYEEMAISYNNLAQIFLFSDSLKSAVYYGEMGLKYALLCGYKDRIAHAYTTQTLINNRQQKNNEALDYEKKAIAILETTGNDIMLSRRYISAAILSSTKEVNDSAGSLFFYQKAIDLSSRVSSKMNLRDVYFFRSGFYSFHKDYNRAMEDYKKHIVYRDSIINEETKSKITDIERKYETEKKDNEINRLNTIQQIKQLQIEKQKAVIAGNAAVALQKQNEIELLSQAQELRDIRIKQQEEQLEKQKLLAITSKQQLQLTENENLLKQKQLKNQKLIRNLFIAGFVLLLLLGLVYLNRFQLKKKLEQQQNMLTIRNTISQDLHDDIGASLSNINILNELARRNISNPEKSQEYLGKASEDIQRISESLSDIVWNINPRYDDLKNLFIRMKRYAADMLEGKQINGQFDFPEDGENRVLSMTKKRDLYLIFKEAINNLTKYSKAKSAIIRVKMDEEAISLFVEDNGKGFDLNSVKMGNGLQNMAQRAKASDAVLSVKSTPGEGTIIHLEMKISK